MFEHREVFSLAWQCGKSVAEVSYESSSGQAWGSVLDITQLWKVSLASSPANWTPDTLRGFVRGFVCRAPGKSIIVALKERPKPTSVCFTTDHLPILTWWQKGEALPFLPQWVGSLPAGLESTPQLGSFCDFRRGWHFGGWQFGSDRNVCISRMDSHPDSLSLLDLGPAAKLSSFLVCFFLPVPNSSSHFFLFFREHFILPYSRTLAFVEIIP